LNEFRQHGDDPDQHLFAFSDALDPTGAFGDKCVQASCTFCGRATRIVKEFGAHVPLSFTVSFSGVEQG